MGSQCKKQQKPELQIAIPIRMIPLPASNQSTADIEKQYILSPIKQSFSSVLYSPKELDEDIGEEDILPDNTSIEQLQPESLMMPLQLASSQPTTNKQSTHLKKASFDSLRGILKNGSNGDSGVLSSNGDCTNKKKVHFARPRRSMQSSRFQMML